MRTFYFVNWVVFFFAFSMPVKAQSEYCPVQRVQTHFQSKLVPTRIYNGTVDGFNAYLENHDREHGEILAFVETDYNELFTELEYHFEFIDMDDGSFCVQLSDVYGSFYAAPALYMPVDYPKSSCEYKEILKHEKRHLQAVYDYHNRNKSRYASFLGRVAQRIPSYPPVNTDREAQAVQEDIINHFDESFREQEYRSLLELVHDQAKIDSPSEYRGVMMRCQNW